MADSASRGLFERSRGALFLSYLLLGIIALLAGRYLEYETAAWVCLGLGVLGTLISGSMITGNMIWVLISDTMRGLRRQPK